MRRFLLSSVCLCVLCGEQVLTTSANSPHFRAGPFTGPMNLRRTNSTRIDNEGFRLAGSAIKVAAQFSCGHSRSKVDVCIAGRKRWYAAASSSVLTARTVTCDPSPFEVFSETGISDDARLAPARPEVQDDDFPLRSLSRTLRSVSCTVKSGAGERSGAAWAGHWQPAKTPAAPAES